MSTETTPKRRVLRIGVTLLALVSLTRAQTPAELELDRLTAAAEQGDATAQMKLGMHYYGRTRKREAPDYAQALKWFRRAADQGNVQGEDLLGIMYSQGRGVTQDFAEAARWYLLAAKQGNVHAQLQLADLYRRGVGVPRDLNESNQWTKLANKQHPKRTATSPWMLLVGGLLAVIGFAIGLFALQRKALEGGPRLTVEVFVHVVGIALVLNTLTTYGFAVVFPQCSHNFLATSCTQIADPNTRKIVDAIGDWSVVNLIFRFMAGIGLVLDALAVWYTVYLWRRVFLRP